MADESTSNLVDVTFQALHGMLAGHIEVPSPQKLTSYLDLRVERFRKCTNPFNPPSAGSRARVDSSTVTLDDGAKIKVDAADRQFVWAVSKRFMLDEVDSLVLLRSFLYNQGLPDGADAENLVEELVQAITPFYFTERLSLIRCYIPLLRAKENVGDPLHAIATKFLARVLKEPDDFASTLIKDYLRRMQQELPPEIARDIPLATVWAKQLAREQLAMLEVVFWLMWDLVPTAGSIVLEIFKAAYETDLGRKQKYSTLLLEDEGVQLLNDIESIWLVLLTEALNLDHVLDDETFELLELPQDNRTVLASPRHLVQIHELVVGTNNPRYSTVTLAWACILFRLHSSAEAQDEIPRNYEDIVNCTSVVPESDPPTPLYQYILMWALHTDVDALRHIEMLLTKSALFVTSVAWSTGSAITDPNAIAFRAVIKGLLVGLCEMCRTEFIPDFSALVDAWVALFGAGEPLNAAPLALQYWVEDWPRHARRQPLDVARARFPVQFRPLVRLLAAMARSREGALYAYHFLNELPSLTHVVVLDASGLYEADVDGTAWMNTRELVFPGGVMVPVGSVGHVVGGDGGPGVPVVMKWDRVYSGWPLLRDVISELARAKAMTAAGKRVVHTVSPPGIVSVRDIGIELAPGEEDALIVDALSLFLNIVKYEPGFISVLMTTLETASQHAASPNIVQLTIVILEDALVRANTATERLITVCMEVLTALLPTYPNRVWPYLKTTTQMFGSEAQVGATPALLTAERIAGQYPMTRALIALVRAMLDDALPRAGSSDMPEQFHGIKEKVLLRALHLIHAEVWLEHAGWRFRELGDRFEIARSIVGLYTDILRSGKGALVDFVLRVFLNEATHASVGPVVTPIVAGQQLLEGMYKARRFAEARELVLLVEALLRFSRLVIVRKPDPQLPCLLEHTFFSAGPGRRVPVDVVTNYVTSRDLGVRVPVEAVALLQTLCSSASGFTLARYLTDPVATAEAMVRIVNHPYDDPVLRHALWRFMAVAVDAQPAFAGLFVAGTFSVPVAKKDEDEKDENQENKRASSVPRSTKTTALDVAVQTTNNWNGIWESNPELLSSALGFLDVVWQHALEHKPALEATRRNAHFAETLAGIALAEAGEAPTTEATRVALVEDRIVSDNHEVVAAHAHRIVAKSRALHILALDVNVDPPGVTAKGKGNETHSLRRLLDVFTDENKLRGQIALAVANSFNPDLHATLVVDVAVAYPALTLDRVADEEQREFGDGYIFDVELLRSRLAHDLNGEESERQLAESILIRTCSVNLNWSLADAETSLTQSWGRVLQLISRSLRDDVAITASLLATAAELAADVTMEVRTGRVMAMVHTERLGLLLGLLETAWFSQGLPEKDKDKENLALLLSSVEGLVSSEVFPPNEALRDRNIPQYHIPLIQIIYVCVRIVRKLGGSHKAFKLDQRLVFKSAFTTCIAFTIDALRTSVDLVGQNSDPNLSRDVELLVAVFGQCIRPEIELWSAFWLSRCQETNLLHATLDLLSRSNLRGSFEETVHARHILELYVALTANGSGAERLALEGALPAFCNSSLTSLLSVGGVDAAADRSPAHWIWCSILSIVTSILNNAALDGGATRIAEDAIGFVQICGAQLERVLSWQVEEPLTLPFLEELELVVGFFYSFAQAHSAADDDVYRGDPGVGAAARTVLRAYAQRVLLLLQHLNYAVTHQNHLESLIEPASTKPPRADLVKRFLVLIENAVATLSAITASDTVFLRRSSDWPVTGNVFLTPNINKTHRAPASFGTLFETVTCVLDDIRTEASDNASLEVAEVVLTFATAQLALWAGRRELDSDSVSGETLRELKSDLVELLSNTKRVVEQSKLADASTTSQLVGGLNRFIGNIVQ